MNRSRATLAALCALLLSSCSPQLPAPVPLPGSQDAPAPPDSETKPVLPGQSGKGTLPNGLPNLEPHGVKIEELFAPDIRDPIERVKRVENAVIELRHDFDAVMPAILRLVEIEKDMQALTAQLDSLVGGPAEDASAQPAPSVADAEPLPQAFITGESETAAPLTPEDTAAAPEEAPAAPELPHQKAEGPAQSVSVPPRTETLAPPEAPAQPPAPRQAEPPKAVAADVVAPSAQPPPQQGPPPRASPPEKPPDKAPAPKKPASAGAGVFVTGLRMGDHGGTARIVLDVTGKTSFRHDLDNSENLLVIELPDAGWNGSPSQTFAADSLVESYTAQPMDGGKGTRVVIQLKAPTSVVSEAALGADKGNPERIVLDLKK